MPVIQRFFHTAGSAALNLPRLFLCAQVRPEIKKKVRRFIPPKEVLPERIRTVVAEFKDVRDPRNGKLLVTAAVTAAVDEVLTHAGRGCFSDYAPVKARLSAPPRAALQAVPLCEHTQYLFEGLLQCNAA